MFNFGILTNIFFFLYFKLDTKIVYSGCSPFINKENVHVRQNDGNKIDRDNRKNQIATGYEF